MKPIKAVIVMMQEEYSFEVNHTYFGKQIGEIVRKTSDNGQPIFYLNDADGERFAEIRPVNFIVWYEG